MSVKRTRDPAGLLPDRVKIDLGDSHPDDLDAFKSMMRFIAPAAKIERLRRHPSLVALADALKAELGPNGSATAALLVEIANAEIKALYLDAAPKVIRDNERDAGTRKKRGSRMPKLDDWLDRADLQATNDALFGLLPDSHDDSDLYRDGDRVVEINRDGREHSITRYGFNKRVTSARKRRK